MIRKDVLYVAGQAAEPAVGAVVLGKGKNPMPLIRLLGIHRNYPNATEVAKGPAKHARGTDVRKS